MIANSFITSLSTALVIGAAFTSVARAANSAPSAPQADLDVIAPVKPAKALVKEVANTILSLGKVETEVENDLTIVTAKLSKQPTWKTLEIEDHGTFLQIKMPGTTIGNSGEFFDGNGPFLKKIASFQVGESDGALRLFVNQDAAKAKLASTAELLGERIVITIDHKKLEQLIKPASKDITPSAAAVAKVEGEKSDSHEEAAVANKSEAIVAQTLSKDSPEAVDTIGTADSLNLKDKLISAAAFCAVMLLFLIGSTFWRNKRIKARKAGKLFDSVEPAPMKVLSNLNLSARQRLSLVQVGSQQILIGISPENIAFLTEVSAKPRAQSSQQQQSFGTHLLQANPNAEVKLKQAEAPSSRPIRRPSEASTAQRPNVSVVAKQVAAQNRVSFSVGDDGVSDLRSRGIKNNKGAADQPFDDITKIIRDRLKNLPPST